MDDVLGDKNEFDFSNLSQSDAWLMLLYFVLQKTHEDLELWEEYSGRLLYKERFSSDHQIITAIRENKNQVMKQIKKGETFYRARRYNDDNTEKVIDYVLKASGKTDEEIQAIKVAVPSYFREMLVMPQLYLPMNQIGDSEQADRAEELFAAWEKWRKKVRFKGYNKKNSLAP